MRKTPTDPYIVRDLDTGKKISGVVEADDDTGAYSTIRMETRYTIAGPYQAPVLDDRGRPVVDWHQGRIRVNKIVKAKK